MAEIYEIGELVRDLQDKWPVEHWGRFDENSIGIVSPYSDQVSRIRIHLRNQKLFGVNVERVFNVQGINQIQRPALLSWVSLGSLGIFRLALWDFLNGKSVWGFF